MSIVTVGFLAIMVLIGGVVALLADNLGRKIGKKRLKIHHKIRPRHTATLFVVGSGLLIPLLTVGLVSWLSSDVRTWILEGEKAIQEAKMLRSQTDDLEGQVSDLKTQVSEQRKELQEQERTVAARLATLNREVTAKEQQRVVLQGRLSTAQSRLTNASQRLNVAAKELKAAQGNTTIARKDWKEAERNYKTALKQRNEAYEDFNKLQAEADANDEKINSQREEIRLLNESKTKAQESFDAQSATLQKNLTAKQKELDDKRQELIDAEAELKRVQGEVTSVRAVAESNRMRRMIYGFGDEVARIVVGEDLTTSQARNQLNTLFRSARVAAEAAGAKGSGRIGAAGLFDQQIGGQMVTAEQQMNALVAQTAGVPQSRILVARAVWNFYADEPVILEVVAFPNKLSFHSGDVISEVKVDGDLSSGQILAMLSSWLASDVKKAALDAGMVPAAGRADALANIAPEDIFDLVAQIKSQSRTARVQAVAFADTYAAGPLKLTFRIR